MFGRMGLFDGFRHPSGFDAELLRRLDERAVANSRVHAGEFTAEQIYLAVAQDEDGTVSHRAVVPFQLAPPQRRGDTWSFTGTTDDLRFLFDLEVTADSPDAIAAFRRHPEFEHGEVARSACALHWRVDVDAAFLAERSPGPLRSGTVVMGAKLRRESHAFSAPGTGSWYLLKCDAPGPFFVAFDPTTGEAEMFPRRLDLDSYNFALELLRVVA
jgi:hypothetical protein